MIEIQSYKIYKWKLLEYYSFQVSKKQANYFRKHRSNDKRKK